MRCPYCQKAFTTKNHKVRHHSHMTGQYVGPCCNNCNLQLKMNKRKGEGNSRDEFFIPIVAHNMKGYDWHIIVKHLRRANIQDGDEITVIPTNSEQFISFSIGNLRFLDSC